MSYTVFYMNPATEQVYEIIREQLPVGWQLTTPKADGDYDEGLATCDFIIVADRAITAEHIVGAPQLRMIQHQGVGYERIDLAACWARKIPVALTPEGTSIGVAEHTLLLILAVYKQLVKAAVGVQGNQWMQWELRSTSYELYGKNLGLIGMGRIGREVANRARAFGAHVTYYDPLVLQPADLNVKCVRDFDVFLGAADIVSLHTPLSSESRHLINARTLGLMKPGAMLVNTSRGGLIDEAALIEALNSGRIQAAALDVLNQEPPDPANPLLRMDNVLITPHISAGTRDALVTKMRAAFANLVRYTRREPPQNLVQELTDMEISYR